MQQKPEVGSRRVSGGNGEQHVTILQVTRENSNWVTLNEGWLFRPHCGLPVDADARSDVSARFLRSSGRASLN
jgi:hypothetical protein